jgi:hypothetical protein
LAQQVGHLRRQDAGLTGLLPGEPKEVPLDLIEPSVQGQVARRLSFRRHLEKVSLGPFDAFLQCHQGESFSLEVAHLGLNLPPMRPA